MLKIRQFSVVFERLGSFELPLNFNETAGIPAIGATPRNRYASRFGGVVKRRGADGLIS